MIQSGPYFGVVYIACSLHGDFDMPSELQTLLPILLPKAIEWVNAQSENILESGSPLNDSGLGLARTVGVARPENIRISVVTNLPLPGDPDLRRVALETGLLGPEMIGVTFGYGIYVCDGHISNRLISHECRHVYQYEVAGSIATWVLPRYHGRLS